MATYRLQKILARGGLASRRKAEELISAGRVRVNGRIVTELGAKADPMHDKIEVDGKRVIAEPFVYVVLHKPRGVVSTMSDPEGRPTVKDYLARVSGRVYSVGRLDFATSGVLLATNDGEFSDALLHPRKSVPKTYVVKVVGEMQETDFERWAQGVRLEDGMTRPADLTFLRHEDGKTWFELTIREGRNQQIRRMGEATGFPVMRLARTSFAGISSESLRPGDFRHLTRDELMELRKEYGVPKKLPTMPTAALETRKRPARAPTTDRHGRAESRTPHREDRTPREDRAPREERAPRGDRAPRSDRPQRGSRPRDGSQVREAIARTFEKPSRRPTDRPRSEPAARSRRPEERPARAPRATDRPTRERAPREHTPRERPTRDRAPREHTPRDRPTRDRPPMERRHPAGGPPASSRPARADTPKDPHDPRKAGASSRPRRPRR